MGQIKNIKLHIVTDIKENDVEVRPVYPCHLRHGRPPPQHRTHIHSSLPAGRLTTRQNIHLGSQGSTHGHAWKARCTEGRRTHGHTVDCRPVHCCFAPT